jgi:lipopolysaccharide transport system permease protein
MEYEIRPKRKFDFGLRELWNYKELFYFFTWRDIKVKYKQTFLGFLWAILQPFVTMVVFTFFFGKLLLAPSSDLPYPVFVLSGLLLWNIFSSGVVNAGNSMVNNSNIIKKIYFPRLIIPFSSILVSVFDFLMALLIFFVVLFYFTLHSGLQIHWIGLIIFLPISVLLACLASFGLGTLLAALNIKYRDFRYLIPFMIQTLLFVTPVIYPINIVGSGLVMKILALNPLYAAIELLRCGMTGTNPDMLLFMISLLSSCLLLFIGIYFFRKTEYYFADLA